MTTARDLIEGGLRKIGAIATGEQASASEISDGLDLLNAMLELWSIEKLLVPVRIREEFTLIPNQAEYFMGPLADFDTQRPVSIMRAGILQNGLETPAEILTDDQWANIGLKTMASGGSYKVYAQNTSPLFTISLWPVPSQAATLVLYSNKLVTSFTNASSQMQLPPGYEIAITYSLAAFMAPDFGRPVPPEVVAIAGSSVASIKRANKQTRIMTPDSFGLIRRPTYDIFKGPW